MDIAESTNIFSNAHVYTQKELLAQVWGIAGEIAQQNLTDYIVVDVFPLPRNGAQVVVEVIDPNTRLRTGKGYTAKVYSISGRETIVSTLQKMFSNEIEIAQVYEQFEGVAAYDPSV